MPVHLFYIDFYRVAPASIQNFHDEHGDHDAVLRLYPRHERFHGIILERRVFKGIVHTPFFFFLHHLQRIFLPARLWWQ
jgi:hypothetical protein